MFLLYSEMLMQRDFRVTTDRRWGCFRDRVEMCCWVEY